jgi:HlyD family secretion protein
MKKLVVIILIVAAAVGGYFYFRKDNKPAYETAVVSRGDIIQEINVTGKVKAAKDINLAFDLAGRVSQVYVNIGDHVISGRALVELENSDLRAELGKTEADHATKEAELKKAELVLQNYFDDILPTVRDAYTKANDAVRKQLADLFLNDEDQNVQLSFTTHNTQVALQLENRRRLMTGTLNNWQGKIVQLESNTADNESLIKILRESRSYLDEVNRLLDVANTTLIESVSLTEATLTSYRSNITTAQNNINAVRDTARSIDQNLAAQAATLTVSQANVAASAAAIKTNLAKLAKTVLRAPFTGSIAKREVEVGEIVTTKDPAITLISAGAYEIEAFIPEVDIARVKIGNNAVITLDAYTDRDIFTATVTAIDPTETIIEGVSTYKTTLKLSEQDNRIRPGMTANIDILTDRREGVLQVPQRAIIQKNGETFVRIPDGIDAYKLIPVVVGLIGSDGDIEIIDGLSEATRVITFISEE